MAQIPEVPCDLVVEAELGGTWTPITSYVLGRDPLTIRRGRSDEATTTEPAELTASLNNRDGRFSPRNPLSPYYGRFGRNTRVRAYVPRGGTHMEIPGAIDDVASTPDSAGISVTGDLDVRIDAETSYWGNLSLCGRYVTAGDQRSWSLQIASNGLLVYVWSSAGTSATGHLSVSTLPVPMYPGRQAIRVTHDVDNGASGNTVTFYTAPTIAGPWTQLGAADVNTGTTSIFDATVPLEVGGLSTLPLISGEGTARSGAPLRVHAFELRSGIGGTLVASPDFTAQAAGTTSFADAQGNTWTLGGAASITNRRWRFHGELADLPTRWDISGTDVWVPMAAGGLLRRLGQADAPLQSTIYRGVMSEDAVVSYWPCEDSSDARQIASALPGGSPLTVIGGVDVGASSAFAGSSGLPLIGSGSLVGQIASYPPTGESQLRFLVSIPAAGTVNGAVLARVTCTGSAARFDVVYNTTSSGSITFKAYDADDNVVMSTGSAVTNLNGTLLRVSLELTQNGANIDCGLGVQSITTVVASQTLLTTINSRTFSRMKALIINPGKVALDDVTVGHISAHSAITDILDLTDELLGWDGETAGNRIKRLCQEEGITFVGIGDLGDTAAMGVQQPASLLTLWQECVDADMGIVFEPRETLGIGYRARSSLYNQPARAALVYSDHELSDALDPTDDDQRIRNDVTASRTSGSSARFEVTEGALSVQDPPDGAGRYPDAVTVNVAGDGQLLDHAAWRAHLGTVDEARYPTLPIAYHSYELQADPTLAAALLDAEIGDRVTVADPPAWLPPDDISQLIQGSNETYTNFLHDAVLNCAPASPYRIAVYDTDRYDTGGSQLAAASDTVSYVNGASTLNSSATESVTVSIPVGTAAGHLMIARIMLISQVTVTAPAGWTLVGSQDAGSNLRYLVYRRVASSEPTSYTWTWTGLGFTKNAGRISTYSGVDTTDPIADFASTGTATSGTSFATNAVTAPSPAGYLAYGVAERHPATGAATTWTTTTIDDAERLDHGTASGSGQDLSHAVFDSARRLDAGDYTRTLTASQTVSQIATFAVVLRPATGLSVATTKGPIWTTAAADFPFDIAVGGEQITVTAISGSSSPQTFAVTRAVNGISKSHDAGTAVSLYTPTYRAL